jgi:DNA-binding HxlR family transcriptional regulator
VGDAWSWLILREAILHGVERWSELQRNVGLAPKTLANRLGRLCDGGLLRREAPASGGGIRYVLTPTGEDFFDCLAVALRWGDEWCADQGPTDLVATHRSCGAPFHGELRCGVCSMPIVATDIQLDSANQASLERATARRQRSPDFSLLERVEPCSIARAKMIDGDRWSALVVRDSFLGTRRFDDFAKRIGVSTNILSNRLGRLVELGFLRKELYQANPPRSEYRMTRKGMEFYPLLLSTLTWGNRWLTEKRWVVRLSHRPCGEALSPVLTCMHCEEPVSREDVEFRRGSD